ncbi:MAG TPA: nucleotide sugar dehydrogenase [Acidimicrobiales bacterium]|nr:nucleotide sugar dehydrogenase [Acidimicrobiales bacterium]
MKVAVVGLGKLGCPLAALLAAAGHDVVGADLSQATVDAVNAGRAPVVESGLDGLMAETGGRLRATTDVSEAAENAEIAFCIVPTPSLPDSSFDTSIAETAFEAIGAGFARRPGGRRVAVLTSTVLPGATMGRIAPALEGGSGQAIGDSLGLCYSPEFIALGSVIENMRHPDMVLMGATADWAATLATDVLRSIASQDVPVASMSVVDAEMTKIAVNTFVTTKISYANMLAEMCERLPGSDAAVVTAALGLDTRIGAKYLRPGPPYGGPCFPRDNAAFAGLARSLGVTADIAVATDTINRRQVDRVVAQIEAAVGHKRRVAVLGLTYKASTPVTEEAFGWNIAARLASLGHEVVAYDPAAEGAPAGVRTAPDIAGATAGAEVVVVGTPWPEFARIEHLDADFVYDGWRIIPRQALRSSARLVCPGTA